MPYDYLTLEAAQEALRDMVADALDDMPEAEASEDDITHDMIGAVAYDCPSEVALELSRVTYGGPTFEVRRLLELRGDGRLLPLDKDEW